VNHRRARRRLSALLDGELAPAERLAVDGHLDRCSRCRRELAELWAAEALLRRLPATVVPLDAGPLGTGRLALLARWAPPPREDPGWRRAGLAGLTGLGVLSTAAALLMVLALSYPPGIIGPAEPAAPAMGRGGRGVEVAARMPSSFLVPNLEASGGLAYTWRR